LVVRIGEHDEIRYVFRVLFAEIDGDGIQIEGAAGGADTDIAIA
jgi:hypothetical protein